MNINEYMKVKGFGVATTFLKKHQIDALIFSVIINGDERTLALKLKEKWNIVVGKTVDLNDEKFIEEMMFIPPYKTYAVINDKGIDGLDSISNKWLIIDLLRKIWFYLFIAENYSNDLTINLVRKVVEENEKREIENNYKKSEDKYYLYNMVDSFGTYEDRLSELGKVIETKYLDELYDAYDFLLDYLEGYDYDRYSELRYIFEIDKKNIIKQNETKQNETKIVIKKKEEGQKNTLTQELVEPEKKEKIVEETSKFDELSYIKEKTFDNALKNAEELLQEYDGIYSNANLCWNMFKKYIEDTEKTIEFLKKQLNAQKTLYEAETSKLRQENDILLNKIKTQEYDMEAIKRKTIEDFILKLNGEENGCVLDLLFDIKIGKEVTPDVMAHVSTIIFNILKKQGYYLMTDDLEKEVSKPADELVKDYRWSSDENINGKTLIVKEPGLIIKKYNRVIYKPKIVIKK